jgi:molybdate transport system substrate-binding protein
VAALLRSSSGKFLFFSWAIFSSLIVWFPFNSMAQTTPQAGQDAPATIAAAADLKFALEAVAREYRQQTGREVRLVFGASGILATQIRNGAPFELYMSADESFVLDLQRDGYMVDSGVVYAHGHLALVTPPNSSLPLDSKLNGLARAVSQGQIARFAIANPEHAPYGRRAREALQASGSWSAIQSKLVFGENVSQALQFAIGGSADGGIVALSLVLSPALKDKLRYSVLDASLHQPLVQRMALTKKAGRPARDFYKFLSEPSARKVLESYGFGLPKGLTR